MITILTDVAPQVAAFEAKGTVSAEDYKNVLIPHIDAVAKKNDKISFLMLMDTDVANYDIGAWVKDIAVGFKHFSQWHRLAVVSDQDWLGKIAEVVGHVIPGNIKSFKRAELQEAKGWVSS
jgi:hypothetical protein